MTRSSRRSVTLTAAATRCSSWGAAATWSSPTRASPARWSSWPPGASRPSPPRQGRSPSRSRRARTGTPWSRWCVDRRAVRRGVPVRYPRAGRGDAHPERRRLRPGGRRHHHRGAGLGPPAGQLTELAAAGCGFGYRTSLFKHGMAGRFVVLGVTFGLTPGPALRPGPVRRAGPDPRRARRRPGAAGRRPGRGAAAAPGQGHGAGPRRPRHPQRGILLHQPGPGPDPGQLPWSDRGRRLAGPAPGCRASRPGTGTVRVPAALADRAGGLHQGLPGRGPAARGSPPSTPWPWSTRARRQPRAC